MMSCDLLTDFVQLSHDAGRNPAYIQGGGGNTSVKLNDTDMAIKSSGLTLMDITAKSGYCRVHYPDIIEYLNQPDDDTDKFSQALKEFCLSSEGNPSMETGFHALLDRYVLHTHSIYANILTCSKEGESIIKKLFPHAAWIPYQTPGRDLILAIKDCIISSPEPFSIFFLQNHGVITTSDSAEETLQLHTELNKKIQDHLKINNDFDPSDTDMNMDFAKGHILFPDQVVYTVSSNKTLLETQAARETIAAYKYLHESITQSQLSHNYIIKEKAQELLGMDSEKHRQKLVK